MSFVLNGISNTVTAAAGLNIVGNISITGTLSAGVFTYTGSQAAISTVTANYTVTAADFTLRCDATTANFTVTLMASPTNGQIYNIKKIDVSANTVTIAGNGHNIDGAATAVISIQYNSVSVQYDSTSATWNII